ncbi:hypothetical protein [Nocardia tengchongensis]|uniref:hypothetical protein n=1 Tax=Nocardia tengchongensis TaxID=2055889 RepID=UPI003609BD2E
MTEPITTPATAAAVPMTPFVVAGTVPADVITDLADFRAQAIEGMGGEGISFQPGGPGTEVFTVPHPLLLEDEQHDALSEVLSTPAIARVLLNTPQDSEVYNRFRAAGGRSGDVMIAWRRLGEGAGAPKSAKR